MVPGTVWTLPGRVIMRRRRVVLMVTEDGEGPGGKQAIEAPGISALLFSVSLLFQLLRRSSVGDSK